MDQTPKKVHKRKSEAELYGLLSRPNIGRVVFGDYEFDTWYGNAAYFSPKQASLGVLGSDYVKCNGLREKRGDNTAGGAQERAQGRAPDRAGSRTPDTGQERAQSLGEGTKEDTADTKDKAEDVWLKRLYVCRYCFKYTDVHLKIQQHYSHCRFNQKFPSVGRLVYRDDDSGYYIKQVSGYKHKLFCQNLSLFSKLFLDDKSVYYNVEMFDFFVVYGADLLAPEPGVLSSHLIPMGFFSKELVSWERNNNLACVCIFPPFQRRHLGLLLIEFLYALAKATPGESISGPEFPLSAFGRVSYLNYWSRRLATILWFHLKNRHNFTLEEVSVLTGFRNEDILLTLEDMGVLQYADNSNKQVVLKLGNLNQWCLDHNIDPAQERTMLNPECLLI